MWRRYKADRDFGGATTAGMEAGCKTSVSQNVRAWKPIHSSDRMTTERANDDRGSNEQRHADNRLEWMVEVVDRKVSTEGSLESFVIPFSLTVRGFFPNNPSTINGCGTVLLERRTKQRSKEEQRKAKHCGAAKRAPGSRRKKGRAALLGAALLGKPEPCNRKGQNRKKRR
ncbi:hypothetical protein F0562_027943 [Nyssa sinensis]|uniref:Uncharacterized protein n=1 Tax=Nyssa sinensis TaxID=561372 RepID=A0A5J5B6N0_9ASTE|nr:hypothetical protein F0562_027943 [Nyssa sinensis]